MTTNRLVRPAPDHRPTRDEVTADLIRDVRPSSTGTRWLMVGLAILAVLGIVGVIMRIADGFDDLSAWGYYAAVVSFLLTTAGAAPLAAIAPNLAKADWVRPIGRLASIFSVVSLVNVLLIIPLLWALPPLVDSEGLRRRSIWFDAPDYSPHIWGTLALVGLAICGLGLLYSSSLPDLAAIRDHGRGWRQRWGARLARGFVGTDGQWRSLRMRIGVMGSFYFLLLIFTHFLISTDFAMSLVAGWRDAIFPMFHAMTSLQSGVAVTILAMYFARRFGKLERYITIEQFWPLSKLLLATSLLWFYFFFSGFIVFWYGRSGSDQMMLELLVLGPYKWAFIAAIFLAFFTPWWLLIWNRLRVSFVGPTVVAAIVLIGNFLDRVRLYVAAWHTSSETNIHDRFIDHVPLSPVWPEVADYLVIVGALGAATLVYLLTTRLIPAVSHWEIQQSLLISRPVRYMRSHAMLIGKPD